MVGLENPHSARLIILSNRWRKKTLQSRMAREADQRASWGPGQGTGITPWDLRGSLEQGSQLVLEPAALTAEELQQVKRILR